MLGKGVELILRTIVRYSCDFPKTLIRHQIPFYVKSFSSKRIIPVEQSFTVFYLISSCGLSPEIAVRASEKVHFGSADKPDLVINLLRDHGFTATHISKLVRKRPTTLVADPEKTLMPKLEFFKSIGFRDAELAMILCSNPILFQSSLDRKLVPFYNYLKSVILMNDKQVRKTFKSLWLFGTDLEKNNFHNVAVLRELGVPDSSISCLFSNYPCALFLDHKKFDKTLQRILEMGLNPLKSAFVYALETMIKISRSTWEHKVQLYRKCGWSEDDFQLAFKKYPFCMRISEKKITGVMDFLVREMGWNPAAIARVPLVLNCDLERRTIPRCLLIRFLISKRLIEKDVYLSTVVMSQKRFLCRFVTKYEEHIPDLLDILTRKVGFAELSFESKELCGWNLL